jgi:hypothetical protein
MLGWISIRSAVAQAVDAEAREYKTDDMNDRL